MQEFFKLGARKFHFLKYKKNVFLRKNKKFFPSDFFYFSSLG